MASTDSTAEIPREPTNVMVSGDATENPIIFYLMTGAKNSDQFSWYVKEKTDNNVTVVFTVFEGNLETGRKYYHESKPIPKDVWNHIQIKKHRFKNGNYRVKLFVSSALSIGTYFDT